MLGYLDPGSGSIIVAAIIAGFAGVGVFLKIMWRRMRHPFSGRKQRTPEEPTDSSEAQVPTADQA